MNGPPPLPTPRRRVSPQMVALLIPLCVLAIPAGLYLKWRISNSRAVSRLEKTARSKGEPLNFAELAAAYGKVPEQDNAYGPLEAVWSNEDPEYWKAFAAGEHDLPKSRRKELPAEIASLIGERTEPRPSDRLSAAQMQTLTQFLAAELEPMSLVREALKRKEFRAPIAFEEGQAALLPYLAPLKRDAAKFYLEACYAVEEDKIDQAMDSIGQVVRISELLRNDQTLIGQLTRLSACRLAIKGIERAVSKQPLSTSQLHRFMELAGRTEATDGIKRAIIGERAEIFGFLDAPERLFQLSKPEDDESPQTSARNSVAGLQLFGKVGINSAAKRRMGEAFEKIIARAGTQGFATNNEIGVITDNVLHDAKKFPPNVLTGMLMPVLGGTVNRFGAVEALRLCALGALRVEIYRAEHSGELPERLEQLPGETLSDPFDGRPLHFKRTDSGYMIYSVGKDRKDNGGLLDPPRSKGLVTQESDIGFRVERQAVK